MSSKLFEKLKLYKNYANDCIFFKYIFDQKDLNDENSKKSDDPTVFKPEYTHQIFGDEEIIFGYKNLKVDYFLTPGSLDAYIGLNFKEKISAQRFEGIEPDNVFEAFNNFGCSPGYTTNLNVFSEKMTADQQFRPYGNKVSEYTRQLADDKVGTFEIYKVDSTLPEFEDQKFIDYMLRVQTMLVYYIETSCFVDTEDPQWTYYLLYEKRKLSNSEYRYLTIGYVSLYNYYAFPDKTRSRISQVMIFPLYERMGHGAELVESVYRDAIQNPNVADITAEDPSPEFIRIRDFITTRMCLTLDSFKDKEKLKKGYSNEMAKEALSKYKMPKLQSRRCYEILRLAAINPNKQDELKDYRLDIKKRLYLPFIRKSKYARNGAEINGESGSDAKPAEAVSSKPKNGLENRFGGGSGVTSNGFGSREIDTVGVTTIGFGNSNGGASKIAPLSINGKVNTVNGNGKKMVSFSGKNTSLNTSNSTTDNSNQSDGDEDEPNAMGQGNLFVSEQERKQYLEEQFQEALNDYNRILKRLEHENISIN
jgi:histone acetyltransferase 1